MLLRQLPSPSAYSKPKGLDSWTGNMGFTSLMCFHRIPPAASQPSSLLPFDAKLSETPVTLLDPILAQLAEDCEHISPSAIDCHFTERVADSMSRAYDDEDGRLKAVWKLFLEEFNCSMLRITIGNGMTDGSYIFYNGLVLNMEIKNEIGLGGGSPHIQNAGYSASHASSDGSKIVRSLSVCPSLLLELAGPNMSLSGSVFSACAICDQLTPMVTLLWLPHSPLMLQAARCFSALRKALSSLEKFYINLSSHSDPSRQGPLISAIPLPEYFHFSGWHRNFLSVHFRPHSPLLHCRGR